MTSDDNNTQKLQRQIYALEKRLKDSNRNARIDELSHIDPTAYTTAGGQQMGYETVSDRIKFLKKRGKVENQNNDEFEKVVKPVVEYLAKNHHPHTQITIDATTAELWESLKVIRTEEFLVD